jgi:hypothetical protein
MTALFKKLNFKEHASIVVINHPVSFEMELAEMKNHTTIYKKFKQVKEATFMICFVSKQNEIEQIATVLKTILKDDAILWFCYPKASSKNYTCDFNRDTGWASLGKINLEPVRQVAIDADWSALRFRNVAFIKTITRKESYALTSEAKKRTTQQGT